LLFLLVKNNYKRMKRFLYIILISINIAVYGQTLPKLSAILDSLQMRIGEQIELKVTAQTDTLSFVDFPELSELGDWEIVKSSNVDTLLNKPSRTLQKTYFLTQWDSGHYVVPPLNVKINDSILHTDSLRVQVQTVKVDTSKQALYDYKELVDIEGNAAQKEVKSNSKWWWLVSLLLLIPLAWYLLKKRREYIEKNKPPTAYEQVRLAFDKLLKQRLWDKDKVDEHYLHLTDTLKNYLEKELHLSAKEKISSQLWQDLKQYKFENNKYLSEELLERLHAVFQRADLAKFAKLKPIDEDIDYDFHTIEDLVNDAHKNIQEILEAKAAERAEKLAKKKRKKRVLYISLASVLLILLSIGGVGYYFLNKSGMTKNVVENISKAAWAYSEYGAAPAIGLTTPHILHAYDAEEVLSESNPEIQKLRQQLVDEFSIYTDVNVVKQYMLLNMNINFKQPIDSSKIESVNQFVLQGMLQQIKAENVKIEQQNTEEGMRYYGSFDAIVPAINKKEHIAFDSYFFDDKEYLRMVFGTYISGNEKNKELISRALSSAELIKD